MQMSYAVHRRCIEFGRRQVHGAIRVFLPCCSYDSVQVELVAALLSVKIIEQCLVDVRLSFSYYYPIWCRQRPSSRYEAHAQARALSSHLAVGLALE